MLVHLVVLISSSAIVRVTVWGVTKWNVCEGCERIFCLSVFADLVVRGFGLHTADANSVGVLSGSPAVFCMAARGKRRDPCGRLASLHAYQDGSSDHTPSCKSEQGQEPNAPSRKAPPPISQADSATYTVQLRSARLVVVLPLLLVLVLLLLLLVRVLLVLVLLVLLLPVLPLVVVLLVLVVLVLVLWVLLLLVRVLLGVRYQCCCFCLLTVLLLVVVQCRTPAARTLTSTTTCLQRFFGSAREGGRSSARPSPSAKPSVVCKKKCMSGLRVSRAV